MNHGTTVAVRANSICCSVVFCATVSMSVAGTGSTTLRNLFDVLTFYQSADLTYNPRVATNLSIGPSFNFSKTVALSVGVGLSREWTRNDVQTSPNEVWLSDPTIGMSYPIYADPNGSVTFNSTTVHVPLSLQAARLRPLRDSTRVSLRPPDFRNWH